jgi:hypothetical protein
LIYRRVPTGTSRVPVGRRKAAVAVAAAAVSCGLLIGFSGCASSDDKYGTTPSFLPTSEIQAHSVLTATAERPALTSNGDAVLARLAGGGSVLITVTGPDVPGEGLPVQKENTTCTWTVTMSSAHGRVPVSVADFTALDHLGGVSHPSLLAGSARPPALLRAGARLTFKIRTVMRTGEGLIRWAPNPPRILSSWDFTVEND